MITYPCYISYLIVPKDETELLLGLEESILGEPFNTYSIEEVRIEAKRQLDEVKTRHSTIYIRKVIICYDEEDEKQKVEELTKLPQLFKIYSKFYKENKNE